MKRALYTFLAALMLITPARALAVSAESYIVIDADTGTTLYEHDADRRMRIASTTKIMTALIAIEKCDPEDEVEITKASTVIEGRPCTSKRGIP